MGPGTVEGGFTITFAWTRSTRGLLCAGETERGGDAAVEVVGCASCASRFRDVDEARLLHRNTERSFRLSRCFIDNRSSSWGVDMAMRVGGRPHGAHEPAICYRLSHVSHYEHSCCQRKFDMSLPSPEYDVTKQCQVNLGSQSTVSSARLSLHILDRIMLARSNTKVDQERMSGRGYEMSHFLEIKTKKFWKGGVV